MGKVAVLGLGLSGQGAVRWLVHQGKQVIGIDKKETVSEGCSRLYLEHEELPWDSIDQLVVSPGISPLHPVYKEAVSRKVPVIGEAELSLAHYQKPMVAITGTNGKTTVTLLVEHVLKVAGKRAKAIGNVGVSLCDYLLKKQEEEIFVVELSSYQLETMKTPVFQSAVLLNITPDHLDRYASLHEYARAKCRLEGLVKGKNSFFVCRSGMDEYLDLLQKPCFLGWDPSCPLWTNGEEVLEGEEVLFRFASQTIQARHDCENYLAAFALCRTLGVTPDMFKKALQTFKKPSHRIERVEQINGVTYFDDSKGTNIDAVIQAVRAMSGPVILIAGGVDKGASYLLWKEVFQDKVKTIIAIGQAAEKIEKELGDFFPVHRCCSMAQAVDKASCIGVQGDCVLLSPGCSSFDMFVDYAHRGDEFKKCVYSLEGGGGI